MSSEEASKKKAGEAPATTINPNPSQRRGNYRGKHFDPNYHQTGRRQQTQQSPQVRKVATGTSATKFSGIIDDLKGHIYDVGYGQQSDAFVKTTEKKRGTGPYMQTKYRHKGRNREITGRNYNPGSKSDNKRSA